MKCPRCGKFSSVVETRPGEHLTTRRRRECGNGHRFTTVEIHGAAYSNVKQRVGQYAKAAANRIARWVRNLRIAKDPRPSRAVAADYGITDGRVRQARRAMRAGNAKP